MVSYMRWHTSYPLQCLSLWHGTYLLWLIPSTRVVSYAKANVSCGVFPFLCSVFLLLLSPTPSSLWELPSPVHDEEVEREVQVRQQRLRRKMTSAEMILGRTLSQKKSVFEDFSWKSFPVYGLFGRLDSSQMWTTHMMANVHDCCVLCCASCKKKDDEENAFMEDDSMFD